MQIMKNLMFVFLPFPNTSSPQKKEMYLEVWIETYLEELIQETFHKPVTNNGLDTFFFLTVELVALS